MNSLPFTEDLFLVAQQLPHKAQPITEQPPVNEVIIIDGSGSISSVFKRMIGDIKATLDTKPKNTILHVGCFSSRGEFGWIVKGLSLEYKSQIQGMLDSFQPWFNMTCFSEIFADTETLIEQFSRISENFSLLFLTDGDDNQDEGRLLDILRRIAPRVRVAKAIGYGFWYKRERLLKIANALGGTFEHADNLKEFELHLGKFGEASGQAEPKLAVKLQTNPLYGIAFTMANSGVEVVQVDDKNRVLVSQGTDAIYFFHQDPLGKAHESVNQHISESAVYAAARVLLQNDRVPEALNVLGWLGDIDMVNQVNNAFTISEYGAVEAIIGDAVYKPELRFVGGQRKGCVPNANAFCLLDLLEILIADEHVKFMPYHPTFEYKRTGRPSITDPGYPTFDVPQDVKVSLKGLVWTNEKMNLGVEVRIPGTIKLDEHASELKLDQLFASQLIRNYLFIFDGKRNIDKLPLADVSPELMDIFKLHNLIDYNYFSSQPGQALLDLTRLPLISRAIAQRYTDLDKLCDMVLEKLTKDAESKVYGYLFRQLPADLQDKIDSLVRGVTYTDAQMEYLTRFGIRKDGSFGPPKTQPPSTDHVLITKITFTIDKMASLAEVDEVIEKLAPPKPNGSGKTAKPKALTPREQLIATPYQAFLALHGASSDVQKAVWLKETMKANKRESMKLAAEINQARCALMLAKLAFTQTKTPKLADVTEHERNGKKFVIKIDRNVKHAV